ncbi:MAG: helix-turn-helix domain-containing protein [Verrucomicrobia bacterium]|nr:helix-turn-helix domain-containing protein [Verrucomicrobiota bacterium]MBT7066400.1 helix-turn-helix domain-containing protein [Verrucomicrobiota bacterium]MBT7701276.1 helix-turn-helix domain-containing protein [Verrucomicrobiota bacterium]
MQDQSTLRLRAERLRRNDTQTIFATRLGISVPTLRKMESGNPGVSVGHWLAALNILDRAGDLDAILAAPEDLLAKYDQMKQSLPRRASRRSR